MAHRVPSRASAKVARPGLAAARRRVGFNQQTFADELEVTKHTVSQWETGATGINPRRRVPMALLLGISLTELDRLINGAPLAEPPNPREPTDDQAFPYARPRQRALIVVCPHQRSATYPIRITWPIRLTQAPR